MSYADDFNDEMSEELAEDLKTWANCPTADCPNKVCRWAGEGMCAPCSKWIIGPAEMDRRYAATHNSDGEWTGAVAC